MGRDAASNRTTEQTPTLWAISSDDSDTLDKMRLVIIVFIILTGCRSIEVDFFELERKPEIRKLNEVIYNYRSKKNTWPSQLDWDSLKNTSDYLKRFVNVTLSDNGVSLNVSFKLEYQVFEDPIQSLEVNEDFAPNGVISMNITDLVLQKNIALGTRTKLTSNEKKQFKEWEKLRKSNRQLTIENIKTKETRNLAVGTHIYIFTQRDSLNYINSRFNPETKQYDYLQAEWVLSTINTSDSTINVDIYGAGLLRKRLKFSEIDSLYLKSSRGTFRITRVNDTAHNNVHEP